MSKYVKLTNVSMFFDRPVLKNIDLTINYGDKIGILGRNGSGKSTLIKIISGALRPTTGYVEKKMKVSWPLAFQGGFQGSLTGLDNLKFICRIYNVNWKEKVDFVMSFSELGEYFYKPVKTYSSGMRARLAFALSIAIDFDCYLIDEIVVVGDSRFHDKCRIELFEGKKEKSFVIVSHQPSYIKEFCNRFFVLFKGKLLEFDSFDSAWKFYSTQ